MRILKYFMIITAVSLISALIFFYEILNLNIFRPEIEKNITAALGIPVQINGDVSLRKSLIPIVQIEGVTIYSPPGFKHRELLVIKNTRLYVSFLALLHGSIVPKSIELTDVSVNVETNPQGKKNWQPLVKLGAKHTDPSNEIPEFVARNISLHYYNGKNQDAVIIHRAHLKYLAEKKRVEVVVSGVYRKKRFNINGNVDITADPLPYKINLLGNYNNVNFSTKGAMNSYSQKQWLSVQQTLNTRNLQDLSFLYGEQLPRIKPFKLDIKVMASGDSYKLSPINGDIANAKLTGNLNVNIKGSMMSAKGKLMLQSADTGRFLRNTSINKSFQGGQLSIDVVARANNRNFWSSLNGQLNIAVNKTFYNTQEHGGFIKILAGNKAKKGIPINCFIGSFSIEKGIAHSKALVFDTPGATVIGTGTIDLVKERLNLKLVPKTKGLNVSALVTSFSVAGPIDNPRVLPTVSKTGVAKVLFGVVTGTGLIGIIGAEVAMDLGHGFQESACVKVLKKSKK